MNETSKMKLNQFKDVPIPVLDHAARRQMDEN